MCKKAMFSGAGSGKKNIGAGAAPKQNGSETLICFTFVPYFCSGSSHVLPLKS